MKHAGEPLLTGKQAECYANDFIGLHVKSIAGGQHPAGHASSTPMPSDLDHDRFNGGVLVGLGRELWRSRSASR